MRRQKSVHKQSVTLCRCLSSTVTTRWFVCIPFNHCRCYCCCRLPMIVFSCCFFFVEFVYSPIWNNDAILMLFNVLLDSSLDSHRFGYNVSTVFLYKNQIFSAFINCFIIHEVKESKTASRKKRTNITKWAYAINIKHNRHQLPSDGMRACNE